LPLHSYFSAAPLPADFESASLPAGRFKPATTILLPMQKPVPHQAVRGQSPIRKILLCVTGLSPQIVTETLFALAVESSPPWIPDEIRLITTQRGAENARLMLLSDHPGWFRRLCDDWGLSHIAFDAANIEILSQS
jgi:hypothetical protein